MFTKTITFRSIFITLCILMAANLCVNLLTAGKNPRPDNFQLVVSEELDHDGLCVCDGHDPNCTRMDDMPSYDETVRMLKDFQLDMQYNGDIIIYALEGNSQIYVGVQRYTDKCTLLETIHKHIRDND